MNENLKKTVFGALLAAIVCVATLVVQWPSPVNGYVNLGDAFVLLSGWLLGPLYGTAAAGIGSMLTDLISGYPHYAPGTLVIKALVALAAALVYKALGKKNYALPISAVLGEIIMVLGYFGYAALLLGKGITAALSIPGNLIQAAVGVAAGTALMLVMKKFKIDRMFTDGGHNS